MKNQLFFKKVEKLFVISVRTKKLSPEKLSPKSSVGTGEQYNQKGIM